MEKEVDVIVIGTGAGADFARELARNRKIKIALIEMDPDDGGIRVGGKCFWYGCIKAKVFVRRVEEAVANGTPLEELAEDIKDHLNEAPAVLSSGLKKLLEGYKNIELIRGKGTPVQLQGKKVVEVEPNGGENITVKGDVLVLAEGSVPLLWPALNADNTDNIVDSNGLFGVLESGVLPMDITGEGAGPIGMEFLTGLQALGAKINVVDFLPRVLPLEDGEVSAAFEGYLKSRGAGIYTGHGVVENTVLEPGKKVKATISKDDEKKEVESGYILAALGTKRRNMENLDRLGVEMARRPDGTPVGVQVGDEFETNIGGLYVLGDQVATVNGVIQPMLRHMGTVGAEVAAESVLKRYEDSEKARSLLTTTASSFGFDDSLRYMVAVTYFPGKDVGHVGRTREEMEKLGEEFREKRHSLRDFEEIEALTWEEDCFKVIEDRDGKIAGFHSIGHYGGELTSLAQLARARDMSVQDFLSTMKGVLEDVETVKKGGRTSGLKMEDGLLRVGDDLKSLREKAKEEGKKPGDILEVFAPYATNGRIVASSRVGEEDVLNGLKEKKCGIIVNRETREVLAGWTAADEFGWEIIKYILFCVRTGMTTETIAETVHAHPLVTELPYEVAKRANTIIKESQLRAARKG
jgi:dihydrolipoamide dehydrogenase